MNRNQGMALISVLLIFAIVAVLAVAMVERQASDIQRSATMLAMSQAQAYVLGAEDAVKTGLYLAWQQNKDTVHGQEEWAKDRKFPLSPGMAFIRIRDAQGLFNLNTLTPKAANRDRQRQRFANLLNLLGIDPTIATHAAKWMDESSQADDTYQSKTPPYRAAYQGCIHSSELLLVEGMDLKIYARLEPYIACLPITAALNVNTAPALVLAALDSSLNIAQGESMVRSRGEKGFSKLDDFWTLNEVRPFTEVDPNDKSKVRWEQSDFSVKSEFFTAFIRVDLAERIASSEVLIKREAGNGKMSTVYRDFSRREARADTKSPHNNPEQFELPQT